MLSLPIQQADSASAAESADTAESACAAKSTTVTYSVNAAIYTYLIRLLKCAIIIAILSFIMTRALVCHFQQTIRSGLLSAIMASTSTFGKECFYILMISLK